MTPVNPSARGSVVLGAQIETIRSFDPADAFELSAREATGNIYQKLVVADSADPNIIIGDLAVSWTTNPEGNEYTFHLNPNARFASGRAVTADDVVYSLQRAIRMEKAPSVILSDADDLQRAVRALSKHVVAISLPRNVAPSLLLNFLSAEVASVLDAESVSGNERDGDLGHGWLQSNSAGSGAYRLASWVPGEKYVLLPNPFYTGRPPQIPALEVLHIPDADRQAEMLLAGEIDVARTLNRPQLAAIETDAGMDISVGPHLGILYLGLNQQNTLLSKPPVIEALKWLVNYDLICQDLLSPGFKPHQTFIPSGIAGAIDDRPYSFEPERAKGLLKSAGIDGPVELRLHVAPMTPVKEIAEALQESFRAGGVSLILQFHSYRELLHLYRERQHELILLMWGSDYGDPYSNTQAFVMNSGTSSELRTLAWRNSWRSTSLEELAEKAVYEQDYAKRIALYEELQRRHLREAPFIFFAQRVQVIAHRQNIKGIELGAMVNRYGKVFRQG